MRSRISVACTLLPAAVALSACQPANDGAEAPTVAAAATSWPASLPVVGDGFPNAGDPCRKIGESAATVDYLDDSATLAGCMSADDAAKLGGKVVATVDGITLVSVPTGGMNAPVATGDAKVAGTNYNATAKIRCSGYKGAAAGMCDAGVVRGGDGGPYVEVSLPGGVKRTIFFNKDGSFLSVATAEADGTAAMKMGSSRDGDTTIVTLGTERYEIPDAFTLGG